MEKILVIFIVLISLFAKNANCMQSDSLFFAKDTLIKIEAKPNKKFNYSYFLYIPAGVPLNVSLNLVVEPNNTGFTNDTIEVHEREARSAANKLSIGHYLSKKLKAPFLVPIFPRPKSQYLIYTHAFDRDAALIKKGKMKRLDLQLINMIADAKDVLKNFNIKLADKIFLNGFSASASFSNRFTLIHPEVVAAVATGGINGITILPLRKLNNSTLNFPLGINDFKSIFGKMPNLELYKSVPQFIYMGENDNNDAVLYSDAYGDKERETIYKVIGKTMMPDRWKTCQRIYKESNINATFKTFPKIGHETDLTTVTEILIFFKKISEQNNFK